MAGGRAHGGRSSEPLAAAPSASPAYPSPRPVELWGVLNVTPDSFSDGGQFLSPAAAVARAKSMLLEGAFVLDVGGASSRPRGATYGAGAAPVTPEEERARVESVIAVLARELGARVSIDTTQASVARAALAAGARIVNDVSMGASEALLGAVAEHDAELVLMHTRGDGSLDPAHTRYEDVVLEVRSELARAVQRAVSLGVRPENIWVDPGLGFAKTAEQSATLLARLPELVSLGPRVRVGASRKSFISVLAPKRDGAAPAPDARLGGSLAALVLSVLGGASAVRVHDVAESFQALGVARATLSRGAQGACRAG